MSQAPGDPAPPAPDPDTVPTTVLRRHGVPAPSRAAGRSSGAPLVVPALVALFAVVAMVGAWKTLQARQDPGSVAPPPAGPAPTASATPTTSRPSSPTPSASPGATRTAAPDPGSGSAAAPRRNRAAPVVVLNATSRTGLAAAYASRLRAKGWRTVTVGNWRGGGVPRTTVFSDRYPVATRTLRRDARVTGPVRRPLAGMPADRLVLVLAR